MPQPPNQQVQNKPAVPHFTRIVLILSASVIDLFRFIALLVIPFFVAVIVAGVAAPVTFGIGLVTLGLGGAASAASSFGVGYLIGQVFGWTLALLFNLFAYIGFLFTFYFIGKKYGVPVSFARISGGVVLGILPIPLPSWTGTVAWTLYGAHGGTLNQLLPRSLRAQRTSKSVALPNTIPLRKDLSTSPKNTSIDARPASNDNYARPRLIA